MIDNSTYIPGASNDFFSAEAYRARMVAYIKGVRKYKMKADADSQNKEKYEGSEVE